MSIHYENTKKVRGHDVELIFFDKSRALEFNPEYVSLIKNAPKLFKDYFVTQWFLKDASGFEYKLYKLYLDINGTTATPKTTSTTLSNIFSKYLFERFLDNNGLDLDTKYDLSFIKKYIDPLTIYSKRVNKPKVIWDCNNLLENDFSAILIKNDEIVGIVSSEKMKPKIVNEFLLKKQLMYEDMVLYISTVDIQENYQGQGLCKPLLSFMIKNLKRLGYEQLFIENDSKTHNGVPACLCYYRSGIDMGYLMRYKNKKEQFVVMKESECQKNPIVRSYYYISKDISKRALSKLKRVIKSKKFKDITKKIKSKSKLKNMLQISPSSSPSSPSSLSPSSKIRESSLYSNRRYRNTNNS